MHGIIIIKDLIKLKIFVKIFMWTVTYFDIPKFVDMSMSNCQCHQKMLKNMLVLLTMSTDFAPPKFGMSTQILLTMSTDCVRCQEFQS